MLKYNIAKLEKDAKTVDVTFIDENLDITHTRSVNVVFTEGEYDEEATKLRVEEVARGVQHKIDVGIISPIVPTQENQTP